MLIFKRKIDFLYFENQVILLLAVLAGVLNFLNQQNFLIAIKISGAVLLTWLLARELDRKRKYGAYIGVAYFVFRSFSVSLLPISFLEPIYLILLLRLLKDQSAGNKRLIEAGILLAFALLLSIIQKQAFYLSFFFIALYLNGEISESLADYIYEKAEGKPEQLESLQEKNIIHHLISALAGAGAALAIFYFLLNAKFPRPILTGLGLVIILILYSMIALIDQELEINYLGHKIHSKKVLRNQLFFVWMILNILLLTDTPLANRWIYVGGMLSFIIYQPFYNKFLVKNNNNKDSLSEM